jgi:RNA polymerase-binding transcription factor DksA
MFGTELAQERTDTLKKIEELEKRMLIQIQNGELFSQDADDARERGDGQAQMDNIAAQQTCMISASAYANVVIALRKKIEMGELT